MKQACTLLVAAAVVSSSIDCAAGNLLPIAKKGARIGALGGASVGEIIGATWDAPGVGVPSPSF